MFAVKGAMLQDNQKNSLNESYYLTWLRPKDVNLKLTYCFSVKVVPYVIPMLMLLISMGKSITSPNS